MPKGIFYSVATPIGNLADITFRACDVLKSVDLILCEDTRNTTVLVEKYGITTSLKSYHKFNETERSKEIVELLLSGKNVALVTDAGTPCISDPGSILIKELMNNGIKIVPIAGACAISTFLSALYREQETFVFVGFFPRKNNEQKELLNQYNDTNIVFYESPNRLLDTLENISTFFPDKKIAIGRELTKKFEEILVDTPENLIKHFQINPLKGEIVGMFYASENNFSHEEKQIIDNILKLKELNYSNKDISNILSTIFNLKKKDVYNLCLNIPL